MRWLIIICELIISACPSRTCNPVHNRNPSTIPDPDPDPGPDSDPNRTLKTPPHSTQYGSCCLLMSDMQHHNYKPCRDHNHDPPNPNRAPILIKTRDGMSIYQCRSRPSASNPNPKPNPNPNPTPRTIPVPIASECVQAKAPH